MNYYITIPRFCYLITSYTVWCVLLGFLPYLIFSIIKRNNLATKIYLLVEFVCLIVLLLFALLSPRIH